MLVRKGLTLRRTKGRTSRAFQSLRGAEHDTGHFWRFTANLKATHYFKETTPCVMYRRQIRLQSCFNSSSWHTSSQARSLDQHRISVELTKHYRTNEKNLFNRQKHHHGCTATLTTVTLSVLLLLLLTINDS